MDAATFTWIFIFCLGTTTAFKAWLAQRHLKHIAKYRTAVPSEFKQQVTLENHQKAADYTSSKTRLSIINLIYGSLILLGLTLGGGIQLIYQLSNQLFDNLLLQGACLIIATLVIGSLLELPFSIYQTFVVEERFGFNKITPALFIQDIIKGIVVSAVLGIPLLMGVLWLMNYAGDYWWCWVWLVWTCFNLLILFIYPNYIAPLFNKFQPMQDDDTRQQIEQLLTRCGFTSNGLFVMDGSKRSAHGNAYFTGFGKNKRIVFFDTLLERLSAKQIQAVLAHELGHFKHNHVTKRIIASFILSLAFLWILGQLIATEWFFQGLGVEQGGTAVGLLLFMLVSPSFTFLLQPISSAYSRKHEFEADAYAASQTSADELINALVTLYQDNASTLTPDPLYSQIYDSHPPAFIRINHLQSLPAKVNS